MNITQILDTVIAGLLLLAALSFTGGQSWYWWQLRDPSASPSKTARQMYSNGVIATWIFIMFALLTWIPKVIISAVGTAKPAAVQRVVGGNTFSTFGDA